MRHSRWFLIVLISFIFIAPERGIASLVVPPTVPNSNCSSGSIVGHPPINQIPTYDYGVEGLVQFHFHFTMPEWNYNTLRVGLYNESCILDSEPGRGQVGGAYLPPVQNLLVKVADSEPGKFNFKVYDEDTGEFQGIGLGFVPNDFNSPNLNITLSNVTGSYNAPIVDVITTPTVPLRKPNTAPQRNPVLIVPGIMGTELFNNENLLWPNINKMFTDVGDNFLDDLAFTPDLTPTNNSVTAGDLVKEPFYGEHYYDSLIDSLKQNGYTENQDLFVFPYDWRYGVSDSIVSELASRIQSLAGDYKIDVIAHSTGGLLLKKVIQQQGSTYIDKAIMIGVPNYGAATAAKALLYGDNLSIPWLDSGEIKKIAQNMSVMYDLLPSLKYTGVYDSYFQQLVLDKLHPSLNKLDFSTTTNHLLNDYQLNSQAFNNAESLHTAQFDNFDLAGSGVNVFTLAGCGTPTLSAITEIKESFSGATFPLPVQPAVVSGDDTVPLLSAIGNNPANNTFYLLKSNHGKLPGQAGSTEVINAILTNNVPETFSSNLVTKDQTKCGLRGKLISIFGKVSAQVKSITDEIVYPKQVLGSTTEIQMIEQSNYSLLYLPPNELADKVELHSLSDNNPITVQINDADISKNDGQPEKVFENLQLEQNSVVTLNGLGTTSVIDVQPPISPIVPPAPLTPVVYSGGSSYSPSVSVSALTTIPAATAILTELLKPKLLSHPERSLIKFGPTIYLIEYGQRRGFRTYGEFISYGYKPGDVLEGNRADWHLPEGLIMQAKPGTLVRDTSSKNKPYFLNKNMEKQWISSKSALKRWLKRFTGIFNIDLSGYRVGKTISK